MQKGRAEVVPVEGLTSGSVSQRSGGGGPTRKYVALRRE
jgi:hypothetical protein